MHEFSFTHHLALDIALINRKLDILFDPSEDDLFNNALEHASKNGNGDMGKPDIMFRYGDVMVMIEVKHGTDKQVQWDWRIHPCRSSFNIESSALTSNISAVKSCAENGAVHYLKHALKNKNNLFQNEIRTILSIGASFEDSGQFTAVPYFVDVVTEQGNRFDPFNDAGFFQEQNFRKNLRMARDRINGDEDYSAQIVKMREIVSKCSGKQEVKPVYVMTLLWAMAAPTYREQTLEKGNTFDAVLTYCKDMTDNFGKFPCAKNVLQSFMSNNENDGLVPDCDFYGMAKLVAKNIGLQPTNYFSIAIGSFDLYSRYVMARLVAICLENVVTGRVVDMGSPYGLFGIYSAIQTNTEEKLVLLEEEPVKQLEHLAMLNLYGIKEQNVYPDLSQIKSKLSKCVVADLTDYDNPLKHVRSIMKRVSQGMYGVFTVDKKTITSNDPDNVDSRKMLNSSYTLRKLIGCKEFFVIAIENTPNHSGRKLTEYICGQYQPETHLKNIENGRFKYKRGILSNGNWIK